MFAIPNQTLTSTNLAHHTVYIDDVDTDNDDGTSDDTQQRRHLRSPALQHSSSCATMADDRSSIYLDTISLASDFPAGTGGNVIGNRKSISMSRQTIYHSAEDVNGGGDAAEAASTTAAAATSAAASTGAFLSRMRDAGEPPRQNGGGGGGGRPRNGGLKGSAAADGVDGIAAAAPLVNDEVSARALLSSNKTVTYSEWKSRVKQTRCGPHSKATLLPHLIPRTSICLCFLCNKTKQKPTALINLCA